MSQVGEALDAAAARHATALRPSAGPPGNTRWRRHPFGKSRSPPDEAPPPPSPPPPAAVPDPPAPASNVIGPAGAGWVVRFDRGPVKVYTPDIGLEYLRVVLARPGETWTAVQLDCAVRRLSGVRPLDADRARAADGRGTGARTRGDPVLDAEGRTALRVRLREIDALLEALRNGGRPDGGLSSNGWGTNAPRSTRRSATRSACGERRKNCSTNGTGSVPRSDRRPEGVVPGPRDGDQGHRRPTRPGGLRRAGTDGRQAAQGIGYQDVGGDTVPDYRSSLFRESERLQLENHSYTLDTSFVEAKMGGPQSASAREVRARNPPT